MNSKGIISKVLIGCLISLIISVVQAGTPVWTFKPLTATTITVPQNGTATIQYQVTNQSVKPHTLRMQAIPGITQITAGQGVCGTSFNLPGRGSSCVLSLVVNGSQLTGSISNGPIVCEQGNNNMCYRPSVGDTLQITQGPPMTGPTISGINPGTGPAIGNTGVTITGTNLTGTSSVTFGGIPATSVNVVNSTTVTAVTPAHAVGVVDVVITTPTDMATLANGYTYTVTAVGQPSGGGTLACLSGGNFNLIAAAVDNSAGIEWGGFGTLTNANDPNDGASNTDLIVNVLGASPLYAAGLCDAYEVDSQGNSPCLPGNTCYNDWFLPALNQLNCFDLNQALIGGFVQGGAYWSSTEFDLNSASYEIIPTVVQGNIDKNTLSFVRCARLI